ncbi:MAG: universal stress protein [Thermodesulfobacteriota bacterium]
MYKKILICLDNSDHSTSGIDLALDIASSTGGAVTGLHVYAARLHTLRFRQMEDGLPEKYRKEEELARQREIHNDLITKGLKTISDSYMAVLYAKALSSGAGASSVQREGKNYDEIVKETSGGEYDLVVMGAMGLGRTEKSRIGSVAERTVRRIKTDVLIVKDSESEKEGGIVAAVDGSANSFGAVNAAVSLSKVFDCPLTVAGVYDPNFHYSAFRSIAGVLSEEAANIFRFEEQEKLHSEIIDRGLAKIYQAHVDTAVGAAEREGVRARPVLLAGKPFDELSRYVDKTGARLLVLGKTGIHADEGLDIGSVTENCLRGAGTNVLISSQRFTPPETGSRLNGEGPFRWTDEARKKLERVPPFARGVARMMIEEAAGKAGVSEITAEFAGRVKKDMGR